MSYHVVVVGSYNQDYVWRLPTLPAVSETRFGVFASNAGGKGFNQAVAAHRQGVPTCFFGALGRDDAAATARRLAADFGLTCVWEDHDTVATGTAAVLVDHAGRNLIAVAPGANESLSADFIRAYAAVIGAARVVLCQLENRLDATRAALTIARDRGVLRILNPAPINENVDAATLALADVITPNETELASLLRHVCADAQAATAAANAADLSDDALHRLCRRVGTATVVVTLGQHGCLVSHAPGQLRGDDAEVYRVAAEIVAAVDTTGAGDAFSGALAAAIAQAPALPFRDAVRRAGRVAALSVERSGAAVSMPTRAEVDARFGA